jgi:uncharacterized protein DUF4189
MRRAILKVAGFAVALFVLANAAPAFAEYGAFARDEATGKYGLSWNEANQKQADDAAIKSCNTTGCKVVFRTTAKQCGAIATTDDGKIWGGSTRPTKAAAELAAMEGCQKRTKVQCKVRGAECNK